MLSKIPWKKIDWTNTLFLGLTPPAAIIFTYLHIRHEGLNLWLILPAFLMYLLSGYSITFGYHRLFSHRAFKANPVIRLFTLIFGAAAFQNSVLKWGSDHRRHHTNCDKEKDPYNIQKGFFWAHIGWILVKEDDQFKGKFAKDLENDPLVAWQHKYYLPLCVAVGILLPLYIGHLMGSPIGGLAIIGFVRIVLVHHFTFFINSLCHMIGSRPYTDTNSAMDSWIMAFFSFGEGYHNFHHYFQADYRNGVRWYHFDPTKWMVSLLSKVGLTWDLIETPEEEILKARFQMHQKKFKGQIAATPESSFLSIQKSKFEESLHRIGQLKKDYQRMKIERDESRQASLRELQKRIQLARKEVRESFNDWVSALHHHSLQYTS